MRGTSGEALRAQTDTDYQTAQTDRDSRRKLGSSMDEMVRRGLFQSSVKDSELYDIEAAKNIRKQFLNTNLGITLSGLGNQQAGLGAKKASRQGYWQGRAVQNANEQERYSTRPIHPQHRKPLPRHLTMLLITDGTHMAPTRRLPRALSPRALGPPRGTATAGFGGSPCESLSQSPHCQATSALRSTTRGLRSFSSVSTTATARHREAPRQRPESRPPAKAVASKRTRSSTRHAALAARPTVSTHAGMRI